MSRSPQAWNKFHLVNATHNCDLEGTERQWTVDTLREYIHTKCSRPDSAITQQEADARLPHLLDTNQIMVRADGFITLGKVFFEPDIEGVKVTKKAEDIAKKILANLDDRRPGVSKAWSEDVRDEAVNTWAAMIDEEFGPCVSNNS